jgi:hypothetical protein
LWLSLDKLGMTKRELESSAAARHKIENQQNNGDNEQDVNEATGDVEREAQQPKNEQNNDYRPNKSSHNIPQ